MDTVKGRVIDDDEIKDAYAGKEPYGEWLDSNLVELHSLKIPNERVPEFTYEERQRMQKAFGYTYDELKQSILPMAKNGGEAIAAMGVDTHASGTQQSKTSAVPIISNSCLHR